MYCFSKLIFMFKQTGVSFQNVFSLNIVLNYLLYNFCVENVCFSNVPFENVCLYHLVYCAL